MNSDDPATHTQDLTSESPIHPTQPRPASWVKRFLWRNPFYLASAALFLLGINQLSLDPGFFGSEDRKLVFNFTALQIYELALVGIALFLALRRIWYDATLLVVLESGLVLVQFILVSHAALFGSGMAWTVCLVGTVLAAGRFAGLKRFFPELNLPGGLLVCGGLVLLANLFLPFFFRWTLEPGTPDWDNTSFNTWMFALPALQLMAFFLPGPAHSGSLECQRPWLPFLMFHLWIAATAVHVRCLDYFTPMPFQLFLLAPLLWTVSWTVCARLTDFVPEPTPRWRAAALLFPALATLPAALAPNSTVFFTLTGLNTAVYAGLYVSRKGRPVAGELLLVSCALLFAGLPDSWGQAILAGFSRGRAVSGAVCAYAIVRAALSSHPQVAILGALAVAMEPFCLLPSPSLGVVVQLGCLFFLAHSLRWEDGQHRGAAAGRIIGALFWTAHSFGWTHGDGTRAGWFVASTALLLLGGYAIAWWMRGLRGPGVLPATALLSLLSSPFNAGFEMIRIAPPGLLAVLGSFLLLGAGTALALFKHRESVSPAASLEKPDE